MCISFAFWQVWVEIGFYEHNIETTVCNLKWILFYIAKPFELSFVEVAFCVIWMNIFKISFVHLDLS